MEKVGVRARRFSPTFWQFQHNEAAFSPVSAGWAEPIEAGRSGLRGHLAQRLTVEQSTNAYVKLRPASCNKAPFYSRLYADMLSTWGQSYMGSQ